MLILEIVIILIFLKWIKSLYKLDLRKKYQYANNYYTLKKLVFFKVIFNSRKRLRKEKKS